MANDAGVKQAAALALGESGFSLPLTLTVGFAGHRELTAEVGKALEAAFALVKAALARLEETPLYGGEARLGGAYEGRSQLRLLTGDAPGADRLAIERWQALELGEVHRLYPYRDAGTGAPLTDRPSRAKPEDHLPPPAPGSAWTGIDAVDLDLRISGHAEVGRWLVRHADVLVALWDGAPGHGAGGTADTVLRTFEHRAPVLWVRPGHAEVRLIRPPKLGLAEAAGQLMEKAVEDAEVASATALGAILAEAFAPPGEMLASGPNPEIRTRVDYAGVDPLRPRGLAALFTPLMDATLWRAFGTFRVLAGGAHRPVEAPATSQLPPALAAQGGFAYLTEARREAGRRAQRLSRIHRSEQLVLILIAVAAVAVGASPALVIDPPPPPPPGMSHTEIAHIWAAIAEFLLGGVAFVFAGLARQARRHRRWSDARRLAERLRAAAAIWPLGADITDASIGPASTWTEWRALAVLRAAGPRTGWLDRGELDAIVAWISTEFIGGQARYHTTEHKAAGNIDRVVRGLAEIAFLVLMVSLAAFLAFTAFGNGMPPQVGGWLLVISAVSPAVGAASLALEATNSFSEAAERSARFGRDFEQLRGELSAGAQPSLHEALDLARRAGQLLMEDADSWRDRLDRRRLVRSG